VFIDLLTNKALTFWLYQKARGIINLLNIYDC